MSVKIMSLIWERAPYTSGSLLVLLALADWSNDDGVSWPSMERLATKARIDKRSAQRIVRQLAKDGTIKIDEGGGRGKQHRYLIQLETVTNCRPLAEAETVTPVSPITELKGDILNTERVTFQAQRVTSDTQTVTPTSPDPLEEPLEDPPVDTLTPLPPFCGAEFLEALADFEAQRVESKKPLTAAGRKQLYSKLNKVDELTATQMLSDATISGWRGVWKPKGNVNGNGQRFETSSERNIRNLRETSQYVRQLSGETSGEHSEGPPPLLIGTV